MNSLTLPLACLGGLLLCASTTMAQTPAAAARTTSVVGYVWTANNAAVADAAVALRDTVSGQVAAVTRTNTVGEFAFTGVPAGSYVVEFQSTSGQVLALGHPFTVGAGETVATFVRMANAIPSLMSDETRVTLALGGIIAFGGDGAGATPGGGIALGVGRQRAEFVAEASVGRRDGHNDWRLLGGGRLWLVAGARVGLFAQAQAGALVRSGESALALTGGAGVEWRGGGRLAVRLLADVVNDAREHTSGRFSLWFVRR